MSKMSHTPGPWIRDRESGFDCDVRAANGRKIASVNVQCMAKTKQQFDGRKSENEANALLIAAAPELLEALKMIANAENSALDLAYCKGIARAAIAKATGGAA